MEIPINDLITDKISGEWGEDAPIGEDVKVIRTANFTNLGIIDFTNIVYRSIDPRKIQLKKLKKGDIIIEKSGGSPTQPVGRVVFFDLDTDEEYLCNNFTTILRPDNSKVHPKYLFYQLFTGHIRGRTLKYQNKTTGIINLKLDNYLNEKVNVPTHSEQSQIATIIGLSETMIVQRKKSIELLEDFLKSTFIEMFGDPVRNEKNWEKNSIEKYTDCIVPGRDKPKSFTGQTPWFTTEDLIDKGFVIKSKKELGLSDYEIAEVRAKVIPIGSIIMTCVGDLGILSINNEACVVNQQLHTYQCYDNINNIFLMYNLSFLKPYMYKMASTTTVPYMNKTICNSIPVILPSLELQIKFAKIVEKTELLKAQYEKSLIELENLFSSLSQKAFNGDLKFTKDFDANLIALNKPENKIDTSKGMPPERSPINLKDAEKFDAKVPTVEEMSTEKKWLMTFIEDEPFFELLRYAYLPAIHKQLEKSKGITKLEIEELSSDVVVDMYGRMKNSFNQKKFESWLIRLFLFHRDADMNKNDYSLILTNQKNTIQKYLTQYRVFETRHFEFLYEKGKGFAEYKSDESIISICNLALQTAFFRIIIFFTSKDFINWAEDLTNTNLNQFYKSKGLQLESKPKELPEIKKSKSKETKKLVPKITWDKVSFAQVANWVKEKYLGFHFSGEMLIRFLMEEYVTFPDYYSSEELKRNPQLNNSDDLKSFIFSALGNENSFIRLEQHFYNAEKENIKLKITDDDYELIKSREPKERSGVYFSIVEQ